MIHVLPTYIPTDRHKKRVFLFPPPLFAPLTFISLLPFPLLFHFGKFAVSIAKTAEGEKGKAAERKEREREREREMGGSSASVAWGLFPLPLLPSALVLRNPRCRKRSGKGSEAEDVHCQERRGAHGSVEGWGGGGDADAAIGRKRPRDESERGRRFRKKKGKRPR